MLEATADRTLMATTARKAAVEVMVVVFMVGLGHCTVGNDP
jgi:hypothetical protein